MASSPQAQAFIEYLYSHIEPAIQNWSYQTASDIYVIWIVLSLYEDDPRFVVISSLDYGTNAHTTPELARSYRSKWSPGCRAGDVDLSLCNDLDIQGQALRNAYLRTTVTRFSGSDLERKELSEHWQLQKERNHYRAEFSSKQADRLEELNQRFGVTEVERDALEKQSQALHIVYQNVMLSPILNACAAVIQSLHSEDVLERKCGHPVPIGITFSNDIDPVVALEATCNANPADLSRGLEEWMMGCTYAQIEAGQELQREVASKPPVEQAKFWAAASLTSAERRFLDKRTPLSERLKALGTQTTGAKPSANSSASAVAEFVSQLITYIEERASACRIAPYYGSLGNANDVCVDLLSALQSCCYPLGLRNAVHNDDVGRLYQLLARLFRESEGLETVGMTTVLVARALHALRPDQFPTEKFGGGGETANRLLNYRAFGLTKSDPTTPDYDETTEENRIEARRQSRQKGRA